MTELNAKVSRLAHMPGRCQLAAWAFVLTSLGACSALAPTSTPYPSFYSLDANLPTGTAVPLLQTSRTAEMTLIINPPRAAAGFDSSRILYLREPFKLAYYAQSEWVDPPARMLGPLLVRSMAGSGIFRTVAPTSASATGDMRLDTEVIRLQHEFTTQPSRVRFTLRAYLVDEKSRRVLAWREFDASTSSKSEDAYGGVVAANLSVQAVLKDLSQFITESTK